MSCFVPRCSKYRTSNEKIHTFRVPKDPGLLQAWEEAIGRTDKKLTKNCRICHIHFEEDDIMKYHKLIIDGKVINEPRFKWDLREGAIPRLFLNLKEKTKNKPPNNISQDSVSGASQRVEQLLSLDLEVHDDMTAKLEVEKFTNVIVNETENNLNFEEIAESECMVIPKIEPDDVNSSSSVLEDDNTTSKDLTEPDPILTFDTLFNNYKNINVPQGWYIFTLESNKRTVCVSTFNKTKSGAWSPLKQLIIDENFNMKFYIREIIPSNITEFVPTYQSPIEKAQNFQEILAVFDKIGVCSGAARSEQYPSISVMKSGSVKNDVWFSNQCKIILPQTCSLSETRSRSCISCKKFLRCLYKRKERLGKNSDPKIASRTKEEVIELLRRSKEENERLQLRNLQNNNRIESLKIELDVLREELEVKMDDNL